MKGYEAGLCVQGRGLWSALRLTLMLWVVGAALGCGGVEPSSPPPPPTWTVTLLQTTGAGATTRPAVSICPAAGRPCSPLAIGGTFTGNAVVATSRGSEASFKLGPATIVATFGQVELGLVAGAERQLDLRRGRIVLAQDDTSARQTGAATPPVSLVVGLADGSFTVEPATPTTVAVQAHGADRAALTVHRGHITLRPGVGEPLELRAGQSLRLVAGRQPDLRSAATGQLPTGEMGGIDRRRDGKAGADERRGFGTMTARVPRGQEVISGVRLVSHQVRVVIRDGFARTEVEEVFHNDTDRVLEGRYEFALPPDASISRVALWVGDELVEGEVVERRRAERIFKSIVDAPVLPRDPALLEWVSGGRFSLTVFPIPAQQGRRVLLAYDQALSRRGGVTRYVYPMSLGEERATHIDELCFELEASDTRSAVQQIQVPHYGAVVERGKHAKVRFAARNFVPTADMVVTFASEPRPEAQLSAYVPAWNRAPHDGLNGVELTGSDRGFFALRVRADWPPDRAPLPFRRRDRALIVDRSHSQSPETLAGQLAVVAGLLRQLDPDERFVVLACDSACETFPRTGLARATAERLDQVVTWLGQITPGGSSDLAGALLAAARRLESNGAGQIVYLGDGAPSSGELSPARIAARVGDRLTARRIDLRLLGAGRSVDEVVLTGLARHLGASYERVGTGDPLARRIDEIAMGLRRPLVVGATLELPASFVAIHPQTLPNLRLGQELVVVGKLLAAEPGQVTLRGRLAGRPYAWSQPITWTAEARRQNPLVPRLWALARLADLEASGDGPAARDEIVDLSQRYSVMSRHTSFLVLENDAMYREHGIARRRGAGPSAASDARGSLGGSAGTETSAARLAAQLADLDVVTIGALGRRGGGPSRRGGGGFAGGASVGMGDSASSVTGVRAGSTSPSVSTGKSQKVAGPRGSAMVGGAGVAGGVVSNAASVVARMRGRFRRCYQLGLRQNPELQGAVTLTAKLGPNGEVVSVGGGSSTMVVIVPCLKAVVSAGGFAPPEGGGAVIAIPISFVRQDRGTDSSSPRATPAPRPWSVPALPPSAPRRPSWSAPAFELLASHQPGTEAWRSLNEDRISALGAAVVQDPRSRRSHVQLVRGLLRHGRFATALYAARRFATIDPDLDLAQELLAQAATVNGDRRLALEAVDRQTEIRPDSFPAHWRAARAFEASGDEARACAHWRTAAELRPKSDDALFEALRCRARVLDDRAAVLTEARALAAPGQGVRSLVLALERGPSPPYEPTGGGPGLFEAKIACTAAAGACPSVAVITPGGQVLSPWTPSAQRSSPWSVAFAAVPNGTYRTLVLGGAPGARAEVTLRAGSAVRTFTAQGGVTCTVAETRVAIQHR